MAYEALAAKSGVYSGQLHEHKLRDDCANKDINKHEVVLKASKYVPLVVEFPRVDLVERGHEDKRVENHCEMLSW